jgi:hypothetical protein
MNRERAETFLRLLAEAELRDPALRRPPAIRSPDAPLAPMPVTLQRAAWALVEVGALDPETTEAVLADAELALAARRPEPPNPPEAGVIGSAVPGRAAAAGAGSRRFARARLPVRSGRPTPPASAPPPVGPPGGPDRYVPLGIMILFHDETVSGEVDLMSYVHTASGARLLAAWRARDPITARRHGPPPVDGFTVTDDRANRYDLLLDPQGRPHPTCDLRLRPDPPPDIRWLEVTAPGEQGVRLDLEGPHLEHRASLDGRPTPVVSERDLSAGEHLLYRIADRLLTTVPDFPPRVMPGPLASLAAGLGVTIAALEAAEVLSPRSPVPGQVAALCASLGADDHGITAAPAPDLPEPWLSLLSHYLRRRPGSAPAQDGFAAVAAALPELDGLRLVLLGLHHCDGETWLNALAFGQLPRSQPGPLRVERAFPLSVWVRDDIGRWHVARPAAWSGQAGEAALTLRLAPPLTRPSDWIEVRAGWQSAEVQVTVPLRWGYPP